MNYKNIIIILMLYIAYTTYVASYNKELFTSNMGFGNVGNIFSKLSGTKTSLSTQSKSKSSLLMSDLFKNKQNEKSKNSLGSLFSLMSGSKSKKSVSLNSSNSTNSINSTELFTTQEMKTYPQMLKRNCDMTNRLHKQLKKSNFNRCGAGAKGKTDRDTINNKRLCWDDVRKEIVAGMDAESNCVMAALNKPKSGSDVRVELAESKFPSRGAIKSGPIKSVSPANPLKELDLQEGPDFINKHFTGLFDPSKGAGFAEIGSEQKGKTGKYADVNSYNDVGFTSDPAFLYRLSVYNKNKSKAEEFEEYNNQQMNTHANSNIEPQFRYSRSDAYDMAGRLKH